MQFQLLTNLGYSFSYYSENSVDITKNATDESSPPDKKEKIRSNIIVTNDQIIDYNSKSLDDFNIYQQLQQWKIDLIIFGIATDYTSLYQHPNLIKISKLKIGWELMNITATCKSFNYLSAEGRNPLALLFFDYKF